MFNKQNRIMLMLFLLVVTSAAVVNADSVISSLFEGEGEAFTVNDAVYSVNVDFVGSTKAKFSHNGEVTPSLSVGASYTFSDNLRIMVNKIISFSYGGGVRKTEFTLDTAIVCGDGICSSSETCNADKCCNGIVKDFSSDSSNCGSCSSQCPENTVCTTGNCIAVPYCGDGVCDSGEDYTSCSADCQRPVICGDNLCDANENNCCRDCGCSAGYACQNNVCSSLDECSSNTDCDDTDSCTIDSCSGTPKKCSHATDKSCLQATTEEIDVKKDFSVEDSNKEVVEKVLDNANNVNTTEASGVDDGNETEFSKENETGTTKIFPSEQRIQDKAPQLNLISRIASWFKYVFVR